MTVYSNNSYFCFLDLGPLCLQKFLTLKQVEQSELARCVVLLSFYSLPEGQLHGVVVSTVSSHQSGPGF